MQYDSLMFEGQLLMKPQSTDIGAFNYSFQNYCSAIMANQHNPKLQETMLWRWEEKKVYLEKATL